MLKQLTKVLYEECDRSYERFMNRREQQQEDADFYKEVKPHADEIHMKLQKWQEESAKFIDDYHPKHLHMSQIEHARDAMEQFVVQSFYVKTSKKRLIQSIQSTKFTFETYLRILEEVSYDSREENGQTTD